jgi:N utilization substance protein A
VELKSVAREAGARSKVAVAAMSDSIDPIGSCVGQRGSRIQTIIAELGGEKIDIIQYDETPEKFIANSLSPAKVLSISINQDEKKAVVKVAEDQLSLAIGKGGQNVRLAARLTGWNIDIQAQINVKETSKDAKEESEGSKEGVAGSIKQTAEEAGKSEPAEEIKVEEVKEEMEEKKEKKEKKTPSASSGQAKKKKTKKEKEEVIN